MKAQRQRNTSIAASLGLAIVTLTTFGMLKEGPAGVVERLHWALSKPQIRPDEVQDCLFQSLRDPMVQELIADVGPRLRSNVPYHIVQTSTIQGVYLIDVSYEARPEFPARGISWVVVPTNRGPLIDAYSTLRLLRQPIAPISPDMR